jgi:hypothetical protein
MVEVSNELIYKLMLEIQAGQEALTHKVGTIATSMVSVMKRLDDLDARMQAMSKDMHLVTLAVDDHTHRLEQIEKRLGIGTPAN